MRRNPLLQWKRQTLTFTSIAILGADAAIPFAHAAPNGDTMASQPHASIVHLWFNGHSVPAATQSRVIHFPGGVMQVQTVTWGSAGPNRHLQISSETLSPAQVQAMVQHSLWQMRAMQVSMNRQIAQMQSLMHVSFGPFAVPPFSFPVPVTLLSAPSGIPFAGVNPQISMATAKAPSMVSSVPMPPLPGHQTLQVRWDRHRVASSPKIQL